MKIAVTDANIFIDILVLGLDTHFFALELEIHTTLDVFNELLPEQQQILNIYKSVHKLTVHILSHSEQHLLLDPDLPRSLSSPDKSVLLLAKKLDAILLSGDKPLRNIAKIKCIEYHGLIWIFDQLVKSGTLTTDLAIPKLKTLQALNFIYQNSKELNTEIEKRIKSWSSL